MLVEPTSKPSLRLPELSLGTLGAERDHVVTVEVASPTGSVERACSAALGADKRRGHPSSVRLTRCHWPHRA